MTQTPVEWLFDKLWNEPKDKFTWYAIREKAIQMENQQNNKTINMNKKQTAVSWLVNEIFAGKTEAWQNEINQALEMERDQIENDYFEGSCAVLKQNAEGQNYINSIEYYNQKYKQ